VGGRTASGSVDRCCLGVPVMGYRKIVGLKWAQEAREGRGYPPTIRRKGAKARGIRFERDLGAVLGPSWQHGKWFEFDDLNGMGMCQPDWLKITERAVLVLECKYTWLPSGRLQIEELYRPVLEKVYKRPVVGAVVCKVLVAGMDQPVASSLEDALRCGGVWHWLGLGIRACKVPRVVQLEERANG
jgi:hypothetical protein